MVAHVSKGDLCVSSATYQRRQQYADDQPSEGAAISRSAYRFNVLRLDASPSDGDSSPVGARRGDGARVDGTKLLLKP